MKGHSLIELLVVLAVVGMFLVIAVGEKTLNGMQRKFDFDQFMDEVLQLLQTCRWRAINSHSYAGAWITRSGEVYSIALYLDGNRNGIRVADINSGIDRPFQRTRPLLRESGDIAPGFLNPQTPEIPPRSGYLDVSDPIKFGSSDIISFSPSGDSSSGSLYFTCRSAAEMYAIVIYGPTARMKVWKFSNDQWQMVGDR